MTDGSASVRARGRNEEGPGRRLMAGRCRPRASRDVGDVPIELLGDYLPLLADAATSGRKPDAAELDAVGLLGRRAAELGVSAGSAVQLYLSAARRLWQQLPAVVRSRDSEVVRAAAAAVLHVVDEAVARLAEGYNDARRQMVRWEETLRRDFIEDLLRGDADVGRLVERAEPFGLDMARPHQVALAAPSGRLNETEAAISSLERAVVHWAGDRDVLVATKDGWIVALTPADTDVPGRAPVRRRWATSCSPSSSASRAAGPGGSPSAAPTRARTGSPGRTRRHARASPWPCGCGWTAH